MAGCEGRGQGVRAQQWQRPLSLSSSRFAKSLQPKASAEPWGYRPASPAIARTVTAALKACGDHTRGPKRVQHGHSWPAIHSGAWDRRRGWAGMREAAWRARCTPG